MGDCNDEKRVLKKVDLIQNENVSKIEWNVSEVRRNVSKIKSICIQIRNQNLNEK